MILLLLTMVVKQHTQQYQRNAISSKISNQITLHPYLCIESLNHKIDFFWASYSICLR